MKISRDNMQDCIQIYMFFPAYQRLYVKIEINYAKT